MDTILTEDWTDYENRFPYYLEGCDKEGRPGTYMIMRILAFSTLSTMQNYL